MNPQTTKLSEAVKFVVGCTAAALTGAAGDGDYVSLKAFGRIAFVIQVNNGATVTGGAVTLKQATTVAGGGEKALAFSLVRANLDTGASDVLVDTAVVSNTFTTDTTDNKDLLYIVEINAADLDVDNGFDCVRIDVDSMVNAVGCVVYALSDPRYGTDQVAIA